MKPRVEFLTSAASPQQFPPGEVPEVAFLGRSNVGKSSLLNSLAGTKIAHVSSTPGRTRTINFFSLRLKQKQGNPKQANPDLLLADLPGYGYARISREISASWAKFIDPYLEERKQLALCVVLVDANIPPQASDSRLLEFLRSAGREFVVVATKCDRLSGNGLQGALRKLGSAHEVEEVVPYSARSGLGRNDLWSRIKDATAKRND